MKITGLNHITINVDNLEASKAFYREVLRLEPAGSVDMGDHMLTYFRLPQDVRLELIDYQEKSPRLEVEETQVGMYRHFCLETDSLGEAVVRCEKAGIKIRKYPSWVEKLSCSTMLVVDPNGVEIELIEYGGR